MIYDILCTANDVRRNGSTTAVSRHDSTAAANPAATTTDVSSTGSTGPTAIPATATDAGPAVRDASQCCCLWGYELRSAADDPTGDLRDRGAARPADGSPASDVRSVEEVEVVVAQDHISLSRYAYYSGFVQVKATPLTPLI